MQITIWIQKQEIGLNNFNNYILTDQHFKLNHNN